MLEVLCIRNVGSAKSFETFKGGMRITEKLCLYC